MPIISIVLKQNSYVYDSDSESRNAGAEKAYLCLVSPLLKS